MRTHAAIADIVKKWRCGSYTCVVREGGRQNVFYLRPLRLESGFETQFVQSQQLIQCARVVIRQIIQSDGLYMRHAESRQA